MKQLGRSTTTLTMVLAFTRTNLADPIALRKKGRGHPAKLSAATLNLMKKKREKNPMLTASQVQRTSQSWTG
jgi:hypothetical protein